VAVAVVVVVASMGVAAGHPSSHPETGTAAAMSGTDLA